MIHGINTAALMIKLASDITIALAVKEMRYFGCHNNIESIVIFVFVFLLLLMLLQYCLVLKQFQLQIIEIRKTNPENKWLYQIKCTQIKIRHIFPQVKWYVCKTNLYQKINMKANEFCTNVNKQTDCTGTQ